MTFSNFVFGYLVAGIIILEGIIMLISGKVLLGKLLLGWRNNYTAESLSVFARRAGFPTLLFGIGAMLMLYVFDQNFILWLLGVGFVIFLVGVIGYVHCVKKYLKKENN